MLTVALSLIFVIAYTGIALEHPLKINKAASALLAAAGCWCLLSAASDTHDAGRALMDHTADIAGIIFFIMGAMTIVEVIDARGGFIALKNIFSGRGHSVLTWQIGTITFLLSSVLDNLTTAIVMCSVVMKTVESNRARGLLAGLVIIAANAGGAWTPIGDVTTTMLWVSERISTTAILAKLLLPSIASAAVPALLVCWLLRSEPEVKTAAQSSGKANPAILIWGISLLLSVPLVKSVFHVPPFVAMLAALGTLWLVSDFRHRKLHDPSMRPVASALNRIDLGSAMFFLGILLTVAALDTAGILRSLAENVQHHIPDERIVAVIIGMVSAIVDNVPLVAGAIGMYEPSLYPIDHQFWMFLAYCAGTGGSILVIGSAAGVAAMGIARLKFGWYAKVIGPIALAGYAAGLLVLYAQHILLGW